MRVIDTFIARSLKWFLLLFGALTCATLPFVFDITLITPFLGGLVDYTPASVPALRHWGIMVFGIGVLMIAAAFRPWLRFETMLFSTIEKGFMVWLFLVNSKEPWAMGYLGPFLLDATIAAYSLVYFVSSEGRPRRWVMRPSSER